MTSRYPKRVEEYKVDLVNLRDVYEDLRSVYVYTVIDPDGSLVAFCKDPASSDMLAMKLTATDRQLRLLERLKTVFAQTETRELNPGEILGSGTIWHKK